MGGSCQTATLLPEAGCGAGTHQGRKSCTDVPGGVTVGVYRKRTYIETVQGALPVPIKSNRGLAKKSDPKRKVKGE